MSKAQGRPWHVWLIGIVGGLWSSMGVISFMLTQMNVEAVMSRFPPQQREYFESFPWWAVAFWAIGVFGGVIGCLLLLLKNRLAFQVLLASADRGDRLQSRRLVSSWRDGGDGAKRVRWVSPYSPLSSPHSWRITLVR